MIKKYIIKTMDDLAVLSRQIEKSEEPENITLVFEPGFSTRDALNLGKYITTINQKSHIVEIHSFFWDQQLANIHFNTLKTLTLLNDVVGITSLPELIASLKHCPSLNHLKVSIRLERHISILDSCAPLLDSLAALPSLLETLEINCVGSSNWDYNSFNPSVDSEDCALLEKMRTYLEINKNLKIFSVNDQHFLTRLQNFHPALLAEFHALLEKNRGVTVSGLASLQLKLENARKEYHETTEASKRYPNNQRLIATCREAALDVKKIEKDFLKLAEFLISKGEADAGYYLAQEIQLEKPKLAYELLTKVLKDSKFYCKANVMCAHILMDKAVEIEVENSDSKSEDVSSMENERKKLVILHLLQGTLEGDDRILLERLLTDYVHGGKKGLIKEANVFREIPFNDLLLAFLAQLDIMRDSQRQLTAIEQKLKDQAMARQDELKANHNAPNVVASGNGNNIPAPVTLAFDRDRKIRTEAAECRQKASEEKEVEQPMKQSTIDSKISLSKQEM